MKATTLYLPGIFIDDINEIYFQEFAKEYQISDRKDIAKVIKKETGLNFRNVETVDGNFAVYLPNCFGDCPTYKELCGILSHILFVLGSPSLDGVEFSLTEAE